MTTATDRLEVQELGNAGCPRCGLTSCSCYDDGVDPRWERWIVFYSKRWGTTRAETIYDITTHRVQGNEWKQDWEMRNEPLRTPEPPDPALAYYPRELPEEEEYRKHLERTMREEK
ncbi:hypothetical protein LCGC14_2816810 [marine sediment metagenome]|uniref:Uncharacterized protein n=1 Tax=marine sediment metagenome TaxID=412755 RepID=A0A0F8YI74_9ZZZZ